MVLYPLQRDQIRFLLLCRSLCLSQFSKSLNHSPWALSHSFSQPPTTFIYRQSRYQCKSLSLAGDTARLPLHLSRPRPHEPHCVEGIIVAVASKDNTLRLWKFYKAGML
ncbi:hypothetical protein RGQ29_008089 [Quercus rubra]|uniref:Uncharacterized protein n=1 Tax=Quercus rubra TaxID=3512 RepID=A0AAN7I7Z3_QUERU|nr:hypothetical protein RGQ29_008089 [Quercus rubra]